MVTMLALVAARVGVALVPARSAGISPLSASCSRPILDDTPLIELYAAWPRDRHSVLIE